MKSIKKTNRSPILKCKKKLVATPGMMGILLTMTVEDAKEYLKLVQRVFGKNGLEGYVSQISGYMQGI